MTPTVCTVKTTRWSSTNPTNTAAFETNIVARYYLRAIAPKHNQLGTLMSENTVLKMAIAKLQAALAEVEILPATVESEPEAEKKGK